MPCARFCFIFAAGLAACDSQPRDQRAEAAAPPATHTMSASTATADSVLIPGTPDGDLADWVSDIRNGIAAIPALAASDQAAAQSRTLDLYITRQEYAEMYFGVDGRQRQSDELAAAIETAEARFHELMQLLAATERPSGDAVRSAVAALDEQQATVARLWQRSGASLQRSLAQ